MLTTSMIVVVAGFTVQNVMLLTIKCTITSQPYSTIVLSSCEVGMPMFMYSVSLTLS